MPSPEQRRSRRQFAIGPEARREITEVVTWYNRVIKGNGLGGTDDGRSRGRHIRIARTTTGTDTKTGINHPTYPPAPANTFVVEFGTTEFEETPGQQDLTFEPYDPEEKRVAHDINCTYYEEGTMVIVILNHDQWFIVGGLQNLLAFAELDQDLCGETGKTEEEQQGGGIATINAKMLPHCTDFEPANVVSTYGSRGPKGSKVLMVRVACPSEEEDEDEEDNIVTNCSERNEQWDIFVILKRPVCLVQGLDDRESCLVAAGLRIAVEHCPDDEPRIACNIVPYTDCHEDLPPCDLTWVYSPEYACCGQGEPPEPAAQASYSSSLFNPAKSPGRGPSGIFAKRRT